MKAISYTLFLGPLLLCSFLASCQSPIHEPSLELMPVSGGVLKSNSQNPQIIETQIHDLKVSIFEITNDIYSQFISETNRPWIEDGYWGRRSEISPGPRNPAIYISWIDAIYFCNWLSKKDKLTPAYYLRENKVTMNIRAKGYRLPTEAEWIWVASGGQKSNGYLYSGSNDPIEIGVFNNPKSTAIVGSKKPNELGIFDMSGNVEEWCWDIYSPIANENSSIAEARKSGYVFRKLHGGAYNDPIESIPNIWITNAGLEESEADNGFRVVRNK
jgi:sulfatase modifying factor 1